MKQTRINNGALLLDSPDASFKLDAAGLPIAPSPHDHLPTMSMIEEFMLLANHAAAETMLKHYPSTSLLRKHPISEPEKFDGLREQLKRFDLVLDSSSRDAIIKSI